MKLEALNDADGADYGYFAWVKNKLQKKLFTCRSVCLTTKPPESTFYYYNPQPVIMSAIKLRVKF